MSLKHETMKYSTVYDANSTLSRLSRICTRNSNDAEAANAPQTLSAQFSTSEIEWLKQGEAQSASWAKSTKWKKWCLSRRECKRSKLRFFLSTYTRFNINKMTGSTTNRISESFDIRHWYSCRTCPFTCPLKKSEHHICIQVYRWSSLSF